MEKHTSLGSIIEAREHWIKSGLRVGFVPTMGALHDGHLSLIKRARKDTDLVVVSVFLNPKQFGDPSDLNSYPTNIEHDLSLLNKMGIQHAFLPTPDIMYPNGFETFVVNDEASRILCGASRPGHFKGVLTVVLKLLNIVQPTDAFFGLKDFQQLALIKRMVQDLNLPINIVGCPILRDPDGLAMSSRNTLLTAKEREYAPMIYEAMLAVKKDFESGFHDAGAVSRAFRKILSGSYFSVDYAELRDAETLVSYLEKENHQPHFFCAVNIGSVRLIDNLSFF
tara:strand:- start:67 stop:909 length:843 start_codon:yes stop_codon:yes gene_type:complete